MSLVAQASKVNGDAFWVPSAVWQSASTKGMRDWRPRVQPGTVDLQTTGGIPVKTQTADDYEIVPLMFSFMARSDWNALRNWLATNTGNGLSNFTGAFNDYDKGTRRCCEVKRSRGADPIAAESPIYQWRNFDLELCVVGEASYY